MGLGTTETGLGRARRERAKAETTTIDRVMYVVFLFVKYLPDDHKLKSCVEFGAVSKNSFSFLEPFFHALDRNLAHPHQP